MRPLWPGFLINSLVIAVPLWFSTLGALRWRRHILQRREERRGCCGECGYDLRGTPPEHEKCPECGSIIKRANPA